MSRGQGTKKQGLCAQIRRTKQKEPHPRQLAYNQARFTFGSPSLHHRSTPAHHTTKLSALHDEGQVLGQIGLAHVWSPQGGKMAVLRNGLGNQCYVRRMLDHEISIFVPRPRDIASPGSGSAQYLLRIGSGLLTLIIIFGRLRHSRLFVCFL